MSLPNEETAANAQKAFKLLATELMCAYVDGKSLVTGPARIYANAFFQIVLRMKLEPERFEVPKDEKYRMSQSALKQIIEFFQHKDLNILAPTAFMGVLDRIFCSRLNTGDCAAAILLLLLHYFGTWCMDADRNLRVTPFEVLLSIGIECFGESLRGAGLPYYHFGKACEKLGIQLSLGMNFLFHGGHANDVETHAPSFQYPPADDDNVGKLLFIRFDGFKYINTKYTKGQLHSIHKAFCAIQKRNIDKLTYKYSTSKDFHRKVKASTSALLDILAQERNTDFLSLILAANDEEVVERFWKFNNIKPSQMSAIDHEVIKKISEEPFLKEMTTDDFIPPKAFELADDEDDWWTFSDGLGFMTQEDLEFDQLAAQEDERMRELGNDEDEEVSMAKMQNDLVFFCDNVVEEKDEMKRQRNVLKTDYDKSLLQNKAYKEEVERLENIRNEEHRDGLRVIEGYKGKVQKLHDRIIVEREARDSGDANVAAGELQERIAALEAEKLGKDERIAALEAEKLEKAERIAALEAEKIEKAKEERLRRQELIREYEAEIFRLGNPTILERQQQIPEHQQRQVPQIDEPMDEALEEEQHKNPIDPIDEEDEEEDEEGEEEDEDEDIEEHEDENQSSQQPTETATPQSQDEPMYLDDDQETPAGDEDDDDSDDSNQDETPMETDPNVEEPPLAVAATWPVYGRACEGDMNAELLAAKKARYTAYIRKIVKMQMLLHAAQAKAKAGGLVVGI